MEFTISKETIKQTSKCEYHFSCLKSDKRANYPICPVDYANGTNVLFLKQDDAIPCPYQLPFGFGMVCTCPTHFAVHKTRLYQEMLRSE